MKSRAAQWICLSDWIIGGIVFFFGSSGKRTIRDSILVVIGCRCMLDIQQKYKIWGSAKTGYTQVGVIMHAWH